MASPARTDDPRVVLAPLAPVDANIQVEKAEAFVFCNPLHERD